MKKILFSLLLTATFSFGVAGAQTTTVQPQPFTQETIPYFVSNIVVNADNSIDVTERITYNTGPTEHHGIYRDIYPYSSQNIKMAIQNIAVTDENGDPYPYEILNSNGYVRIKIGNPTQTFSGQKTYILKYHATRAVAQFKDIDEIYWNVTGNQWPMPIQDARAGITLPPGAVPTQSACYYGPEGSNNKCQGEIFSSNASDNVYVFNASSTLNPGDGFTVAVGFPKGVVTPYPSSLTNPTFFDKYWQWFLMSLLPILTLILSLLYWYKKGRDAKGTGVIVPQYDVPDRLTPMEAGGIASEKLDVGNISPEIIYLATQGYLKITQLEEKHFGFIKSADYELTKLKDFSDLPNEFDQKLLTALFGEKSSVKLSELKTVFYKDANSIVNSVADSLLTKGYYKNLGRLKSGKTRALILVFASVWVSIFFGALVGRLVLKISPEPIIFAIFLSFIIFILISHFNPAKTQKGADAREYILGLKDYLRIAEKDRLLFHDAPEKKPEIFEKLLPYAMILGVANIWAKEFEGIYTVPPSWYSGPQTGMFSAMAFSHSLNNFSSSAGNVMSSAPGGGSGGGGFSGGGGGGGGGGSW